MNKLYLKIFICVFFVNVINPYSLYAQGKDGLPVLTHDTWFEELEESAAELLPAAALTTIFERSPEAEAINALLQFTDQDSPFPQNLHDLLLRARTREEQQRCDYGLMFCTAGCIPCIGIFASLATKSLAASIIGSIPGGLANVLGLYYAMRRSRADDMQQDLLKRTGEYYLAIARFLLRKWLVSEGENRETIKQIAQIIFSKLYKIKRAFLSENIPADDVKEILISLYAALKYININDMSVLDSCPTLQNDVVTFSRR